MLKSMGEVVWTGAEMVRALASYPHYREDGMLDKWHFVDSPETRHIYSSWLASYLRIGSICTLDLPWMLKQRAVVERQYAKVCAPPAAGSSGTKSAATAALKGAAATLVPA